MPEWHSTAEPSPAEELKKLLSGYGKRDGTRRISPHMRQKRNRSASFQVLHRTLLGFVQGQG
jgi:hypothetical protein